MNWRRERVEVGSVVKGSGLVRDNGKRCGLWKVDMENNRARRS